MSEVYKSLRVIVQDTLQRGKANSMPLARVKGRDALRLNDEMEKLERILAEGIGRLKAAVKEGEAVVVVETKHAEDLIESLRVNGAALETRLKETEDTLRRRETGSQKMEENLTAKIRDLQNNVKKKEEVVESRGNEVSDLKSKLEDHVKQVAELELSVQQVKVEAASQAKRAEHLSEISTAKIAALEAQLRDTEQIVRKKESTIEELEKSLSAKIQDSERLMKNKEELLAGRYAEIKDLKSQLNRLTKGLKDMSSFFRQAEAIASVEGQSVSTAVLPDSSKGGEEKPATLKSKAPKVTPIVPDAVQEIVSPDLFNRITDELTELMGVIGPMGSIIVRDHVVALGESMEKFPKMRLPELLESLGKEILDVNPKIGDRELFRDLLIATKENTH